MNLYFSEASNSYKTCKKRSEEKIDKGEIISLLVSSNPWRLLIGTQGRAFTVCFLSNVTFYNNIARKGKKRGEEKKAHFMPSDICNLKFK